MGEEAREKGKGRIGRRDRQDAILKERERKVSGVAALCEVWHLL